MEFSRNPLNVFTFISSISLTLVIVRVRCWLGSGHPHHFTVMLMTVCSLLFGRQVAAAEVLKGVQQFCHCEVPGIGMFIRVARHTRKRWQLHYHGGWRSKEHGFLIGSSGNNGGSFLSPSKKRALHPSQKPHLQQALAASFLSPSNQGDARLSWSSLSFFGRRFVPWWTWFHCTIFKSLSPRWTWFCLNKPCYYSLLLKKECHTIEARWSKQGKSSDKAIDPVKTDK